MERRTELEKIKDLKNIKLIGYQEQKKLFDALDLTVNPSHIPQIQFSFDELKSLKGDYILILGFGKDLNSEVINIRKFINVFGYHSDNGIPHFYNQDWYNNELFIEHSLENRWYLVKKERIDRSIAVHPDLISKGSNKIDFPSAILCVYTFFANFFYSNGEILWKDSFIWCSDRDVNGDRIYVGKYDNSLNLNKNGFSIHRHLSITKSYGAINFR